MTGWRGFEILDRLTGSTRRVIVGNRDEGYPDITIGGFTDCSVHLEGRSVEGVRARFFAASNHRYLEVQSAPASSLLFASLGQTKRVDLRPFEIGDFTLHILEIGLDSTIKGLAAGSEGFERNIANLEPFGLAGKPACPRLLANILAKNKNVRSKSLETLQKAGRRYGRGWTKANPLSDSADLSLIHI